MRLGARGTALFGGLRRFVDRTPAIGDVAEWPGLVGPPAVAVAASEAVATRATRRRRRY